ncbi:MAG: hypothetical protein K0Q76_2980 [Panacagrimonas sp.]|nr:hypothetical protein [Panacagrimonas sp.]
MQKPRTVIVLLTALLAMPAHAGPKNHYECVLEEMPGTKTDGAAATIWKGCLAKFGSPRDVKQGAARGGWFSFDSGDECAQDKAQDTDSKTAATMISTACRKLYDDPRGPKPAFNPEERGIKFGDLLQ